MTFALEMVKAGGEVRLLITHACAWIHFLTLAKPLWRLFISLNKSDNFISKQPICGLISRAKKSIIPKEDIIMTPEVFFFCFFFSVSFSENKRMTCCFTVPSSFVLNIRYWRINKNNSYWADYIYIYINPYIAHFQVWQVAFRCLKSPFEQRQHKLVIDGLIMLMYAILRLSWRSRLQSLLTWQRHYLFSLAFLQLALL